MGVCLQAFNQMVGLESFEMVVELVEEDKCLYSAGIRGLFHWMICITGIGDGGFQACEV